jgi:hypothetical protein
MARKREAFDALLFVRTTKQQYDQLEAYAAKRQVSLAAATRELLRSVLEANGYKEKEGV